MNVTAATFKVLYDNKNITADISDHIISLTYTDKVEGESDEIEINLEDTDLLWQNAWYPTKGARLEVTIEQDGLVLNCGAFTIDEIEMSSSRGGDTVSIRGLAAFITKKIRTKKSSGHENKSLREIAVTIAAANGLTVVGSIADITFKRITQYQETDLGFLKRLAADYGYTFSVRDTQLIFTSVYDLESRSHVLTIDKTELLSHSVKDKTAEVYKAAKVKHHSSKENETIAADVNNEDADFAKEDTLEIKTKAENKQQAEAKSKAALHKKNSNECTGSVAMPGNTLIIAGNNFELTGMGTLSGINHIVSSSHTIDRSGGYVTSAEVKRVQKIAAAKHKPKTTTTIKNSSAVGQKPLYQSNNDYSWQNATTIFIAGGSADAFN